jgi:hypothetical protein
MSIYGIWPDEVEVIMGRTGYRVISRSSRTGEMCGRTVHVAYDDLEQCAGTRNPHEDVDTESGLLRKAWKIAQHHGYGRLLKAGHRVQ